MKKVKLMLGRFTFMLICLPILIPAAVVAQERYLIAYAGFAGFQSPLWATKEFGLLTKYGINADLILTPGSTRQIQAMLGNSVHFAQVDAVTTINAIAQGADLVMISGSLNTFPFSFVAQKEIRRPEDLTGKKVGIVGFGGANELAVLLALKEWNLPRNAVTGPNFWNVDLAVSKLVAVTGTQRLELRLESFNLLNHFNWGDPIATNLNFNAGTFGRITTLPVGASMRVMQFGIKYDF